MAFFSYDKLWTSEFYSNVSAKDRTQDINLNRKVNDIYRKDEKITKKFCSIQFRRCGKQFFFDKKLSKVESHISYIEKIYIMKLNCITTNSLWKRS